MTWLMNLQAVGKHVAKVLESISAKSEQLCSSRQALQKTKVVKEIKQFNPRFEEDFALEKDYDVDRYTSVAHRIADDLRCGKNIRPC